MVHLPLTLLIDCSNNLSSGVNTIITAVGSSGCGITDADCLCAATKTINQIKKELPQKCKNLDDLNEYGTFFNTQCSGKPGFPIDFEALAAQSGAVSNRARCGVWAVPLVALGVALI